MRTPGLLVLILVAATTTATAQRHEEIGGRVKHTSHAEKHRPPRTDRDWVGLATPTPTRFGTEYIVVGAEAGWFRTLRIDATSGTVSVRRLRVFFHDGFVKTFYVDRLLDRRHASTYIDLGLPRQIDQLAVTTERSPVGTYAVYGTSGSVAPVLVAQQSPAPPAHSLSARPTATLLALGGPGMPGRDTGHTINVVER